MNGDLDDLAGAAANALVSAMTTDSWEVVKRRFAAVVGQERRMDAARAQVAAASGADRGRAQLAQARAWSTRLRDALDDDPRAAQGVRALLADLGAPPPRAAPPSRHARAGHASHAVKAGSAARPIAAIVTAVIVLGAAAVTGWRAHWPAAVFGAAAPANGTAHSAQPARLFGDSYPRWQLQVTAQVSTDDLVRFSDGLVLVSEWSGPTDQVTAYREATGAKAWSRTFPSAPVAAGTLLLDLTYPTSLTAYHSRAASGPCPSAISRINPATGQTMWTSALADATCPPLTASGTYVISGTTILSAADGAAVHRLPANAQGWAFGNDILVQDGSALSLDTFQAGRLRPLWRRDVAGYAVLPEPPQIVLTGIGSGSGPTRIELLNPANGSIARSVTATSPIPIADGVDVFSPVGRVTFLSASGTRAGPDGRDISSYSGQILWGYRSPNGYSTGPVYAYAMDPDSFKVLGRLVTTRSEVSVEGNDSFVVSDGAYAAIVAAPVIYIFRL